MECRNKRRFTYLKELIVGNHPPEEEPNTPNSISPTSTGAMTIPTVEMLLPTPLCS
ncbi:hypothetical protein AHAS_Ahas18G0186900 [Arachis hypogaea]